MTVGELINAATFCDIAEIIVRKGGNGQWVQGYRIGKNAKIFPSEVTAEIRERHGLRKLDCSTISLKEGEQEEFCKAGFKMPMKVICSDIHKNYISEDILNLEVCSFQPRNIPHFHRDALTHNEFALDVNCYVPEEGIPVREAKPKKEKKAAVDNDDELPGQMRIEEFL